jgi:translation initiation factor 2B subunit (eIF-2B alpha/beta/delta family)
MAEILREGCDNLRNDKTNGARTLGTNALSFMLKISRSRSLVECTSSRQYVSRLFFSAYMLTEARPSMRSAITNALISALSELTTRHPLIMSTCYLTGKQDEELLNSLRPDVEHVIHRHLSNRSQRSELADTFCAYLMETKYQTGDRDCISIFTLSASGSISQCLINACTKLQSQRPMKVHILESRPAFEGVKFAENLLKNTDERVQVCVAPDSHVAYLSENTDILLLGADEIAEDGSIKNKIGSLSAALCAKRLGVVKSVVVVSESDKITWKEGRKLQSKGVEEANNTDEVTNTWDTVSASRLNKYGSRLEVLNYYFEWVSADFIDAYITEQGVLSKDGIFEIAKKNHDMERRLFDSELAIKELHWENVW